LRAVRKRQQMTIRIFGEPDPARGPLRRPESGAAFLRARRERLGRLPADARIVRTTFRDLAAASRLEAGEGRVRLIAFHLVDRDRVPEYRRRASMLQAHVKPHVVRVSGPWPAFAFAPELF
jgi:hypothetical protein